MLIHVQLESSPWEPTTIVWMAYYTEVPTAEQLRKDWQEHSAPAGKFGVDGMHLDSLNDEDIQEFPSELSRRANLVRVFFGAAC